MRSRRAGTVMIGGVDGGDVICECVCAGNAERVGAVARVSTCGETGSLRVPGKYFPS